MIFYNATIDVMRSGRTIAWGLRVQIDFPSRSERIISQGAEIPLQLYALPNADFENNDVIEIMALDGQTAQEHPAKYTAGQVERLTSPLPLTSVQLTGLGGYKD